MVPVRVPTRYELANGRRARGVGEKGDKVRFRLDGMSQRHLTTPKELKRDSVLPAGNQCASRHGIMGRTASAVQLRLPPSREGTPLFTMSSS